MNQTWSVIVEPSEPVPITNLSVMITEGLSPAFPITRAYEMNLMNSNWTQFILEQARVNKKELQGTTDESVYYGLIKRVASISSMLRLNNASLESDELTLELAITNFKDYIGTTQSALIDPEFREQLMQAGVEDQGDPSFYFANPLATCVNIVTSDGLVPVGMRSDKVAIYPNVPHVIGGYVKVNGDNNPNFKVADIDLYNNMLKELREELGVSEDQLSSIDFRGIVRNNITQGPEMVFNAIINLTGDELLANWSSNSRDRFEHRNITMYNRADLVKFLEQWSGLMVPSGEAALRLYLKHD